MTTVRTDIMPKNQEAPSLLVDIMTHHDPRKTQKPRSTFSSRRIVLLYAKRRHFSGLLNASSGTRGTG